MNIKTFSKTVLSTFPFTKHLTLVVGGNFFAAGLGFMAVMIISKALTVGDFGLFNLAISVMLAVSILADFGISTSMIRFVSPHLHAKKTAEAAHIFRLAFSIKSAVGFVFAVIIFAAAGPLSEKVFHYSRLTPLIRVAAFGVFFTSTLNYFKSVLYSHKFFSEYVSLQIMVDFIKLLTACILVLYLKMGLFASVMVFAVVPVAGIIFGSNRVGFGFASRKELSGNLTRRFFSYSRWVFVSNACTQAFRYAGIFITARMLGSSAAGIYGLANNLTYIFPILIISLSSVLLPEVSRFRDVRQFENYVRNSLKISSVMGVVIIIPLLLFSRKIIPFLFGVRYLDSVSVFNWLLAGYTVSTVSNTICYAIYSLNKPRTIALVDLTRIAVLIPGSILLIPVLGVLAPAILGLFINTGALIFYVIYVFRKTDGGKVVLAEVEITEVLNVD